MAPAAAPGDPAPVLLVVALVAAKAAQLAWWPDPDGALLWPGLARQSALVALLVWCARWGPKRPSDAHQTPHHGLVCTTGTETSLWCTPELARRVPWLAAIAGVGVALQLGTDPPGLAALNLVLVTALGEEVLFRGLLPAATRHRWLPAVAFGLWHLPDAWSPVDVALTAGAAALLFEPLRRRAGTVLAPAAVHAALNAAGIAFVGW